MKISKELLASSVAYLIGVLLMAFPQLGRYNDLLVYISMGLGSLFLVGDVFDFKTYLHKFAEDFVELTLEEYDEYLEDIAEDLIEEVLGVKYDLQLSDEDRMIIKDKFIDYIENFITDVFLD